MTSDLSSTQNGAESWTRRWLTKKTRISKKVGQTIKTSSVWSSRNGQESGKNVKTRKVFKDGKATEETTEEYTFPSGERKIVKTIKDGDNVTTNEYHLKKGEELPKELKN